MKQLIKLLTSIFTLLLVFNTMLSVSSSAKKPFSGKTFSVATSPNFPPFENKTVDSNGDSKIVGFDMDLLKKLSKDLGFKYKIKETDFTGLIGYLQSGRASLVISGMTATPERAKSVDFSKSYFNAKTAVLHKNNIKIKSGKDLKGLKVAAVFNTQYADQAKKLAAKVTTLDTGTLVAQDLWNGSVQAAMMDQTKAETLLKDHKGYSYYVFTNKELNLSTPNTFSIAFTKGKNKKLQAAINQKLKKYKKDGTLKKIAKKWMGTKVADYQ
ncbi:transporter substrate-binding domain-containing protein [Oenococcus sicerae]|uniref:Transporter substrate-binding domain-containing protein n=1 Tax=Oenococcus sicerae TaxID=2203724 RepID=A0AAJ1R9E8_9LACO|nr:transporter substrate-binding domain-containing protein [Oenococcus sicerae]MDN6899675.1 transporter substrate-binding domain-containing protein [Oenococcus sicerae]QAS70371.1 transporter substrate-binding domain-containing protein [Oenococcus sicerae]